MHDPGGGQTAHASGGPPEAPPLDVKITLICGGLTKVKAPIIVGARYDGLAFGGPTKVFDHVLDSWLTRAVDLGIIGSALGQLFPIDLDQFHKAGKLNAHMLLLAGMGEPGRFAQDGVRFIFSNIIVTIKAIGVNEFATPLLGTRRDELPIGDAVRGLLQGIADGYDRIAAIAENVTENKEIFRAVVRQPLSVLIVHGNEQKIRQIQAELQQLASGTQFSRIKLSVARGDNVDADPPTEQSSTDPEPDVAITYLRITQSKSARAGIVRAKSAAASKRNKSAARASIDPFPTDVFQFSALSEVAVIPQREQEVNAHLLRDLADRLTESGTARQRADQSDFFTNLLIPDDFRKLIEGPASVTLEVDGTTAAYPWEMAGYRKIGGAFFLGTNVAVSRQFRTLLAPPPSSPPALNNNLKVLIIADPAPGPLALPGARAEGIAVVAVLQRVQEAWGAQYKIETTLRMGARDDAGIDAQLKALKESNSTVTDAGSCDPLELAMLLVNEQYDVVHYAGHGMCDSATGQTGWVFASDCVLSAKEIFRVRQVPRLVFANACFSAVATDAGAQRKHMAGLAQAFFGRGIPNYIGAGWEVGDDCAVECASWFYACLLGLTGPTARDGVAAVQSDATIGRALRIARERTWARDPTSSSWGAYQHYGHVSDRLVSIASPEIVEMAAASAPPVVPAGGVQSPTTSPGVRPMANTAQAATASFAADDPNLVYVNGIDFNTGQYAVPPRPLDEMARLIGQRPGIDAFGKTRGDKPRAFALPFGATEKLEDAGWGIVFPTDTPDSIRKALKPLIDFRATRAGKRLKELDYKPGEQLRDWYVRQQIAPGNIHLNKVPYYLLLIGPPDKIPFDFQYLLGIEYAVGRLAFDDPADYESYARSTIAYESAAAVPNAKRVSYWGTRHSGDGATRLSSSFLLDPLINGSPDDGDDPIAKVVGYDQETFLAKDATKAKLLGAMHAAKPPALLFTASHGMQFNSGQAEQVAGQGGLLCQDWPGFGTIKPDHFLTASDVADDANVNGVVAFLFACFGAGTPDQDQFLMDLSQAGTAPTLAPKPFIAALPRRLLTHPKGSALAVIGHIDRAWGFSMQAPNVASPQIAPFRNSIGSILDGKPVGHTMCGQFGARYAELSALLLSATSPTAPAAMRLSDRDLVTAWLERNDAQNYVLLGDPAVRIRNDAFA
jgi:CHAT domain-containing protein/peptidase C25-like protein